MGTEKRERQKANKAKKQVVQAETQEVETRKSRVQTFAMIGLLALAVLGLYWAFSRGDDSTNNANEGPNLSIPDEGASLDQGWECPASDGTSPRTTTMLGEPPNCLDDGASYTASINTDRGTITVTLDPENAPNAVNAFVILSRYQYYNGSGVFSSDTDLGSVTAGAPHTQEANDPGPKFPIVADTAEGNFGSGAVVLNANGTFDLVALDATPGYVDSLGTVIGRMTPDSAALANELINLHQDNTSTFAAGDGAPREAVIIESITINQS